MQYNIEKINEMVKIQSIFCMKLKMVKAKKSDETNNKKTK